MSTQHVATVYVRHSTKAQASGDSHDRQVERAKQWAERNEHELRIIYDNGLSGFTGANRKVGQLGAFVEKLRLGDHGLSPVLLVESFDRLSREDLNQAPILFLELLNAGAKLVTLENGRTYSGKLQLAEALEAICAMDGAHGYSARLAMRVRSSVARRKLDGFVLHNNGSAPGWLQIGPDRKSWLVLPLEVAKLVRVFELAATGNGPTAVAHQLRGEGVAPLPRTKNWTANLIQRLILDRRVMGEFKRRGETEPIANFFPSVVSVELFSRVNEGRVVRTRVSGKKMEYNLLRGLCFDFNGNALIHRTSGFNGRHWEYLVQRERLPGQRFRIRYHRVEATVLYALECLNEDIAAIQARRSDVVTGKILVNAERKTVIERQLEKLKRLFLSDTNPPETLISEMKTLESEKVKVDASLQALELAKTASEKPLDEFVNVFGPDLNNPDIRRTLRSRICLIFSKIIVHDDKLDFYLSGFDVAEKFTIPLVPIEDFRKHRSSPKQSKGVVENVNTSLP